MKGTLSNAVIKLLSIYWSFNMISETDSFWTTHIDCGDISSLNLVNIDTTVRLHNNTKFNSTAEVDCKEGYYNTKQGQNTGISTTTMTCSRNGYWTNKPTCELKNCRPLENLTIPNYHNKLLLNDNTQIEATAIITCKDGYYDNRKSNQPDGISSTLISCSVNGTWTNLPNCTRKDCGNVSTIPIDHAANRSVNTDTMFESTADIECDEGYFIEGQPQGTGTSTKTITCIQTGKWNATPICIRKDCHPVTDLNLNNTSYISLHNDTKYGSTADVSCTVGYFNQKKQQTSTTSTTTIRCSHEGQWVNLPSCVRKDCGPLENLPISNAKKRTLTVNNETKFSSTATIECDIGYMKEGETHKEGISSTIVTCIETGNWFDIPKCIKKDCGDISSLNLANIDTPARLHNDTKYNSKAEVDCMEGYYNTKQGQNTGISTTTMTCSSDGSWTNKPTCIIKDCGPLENLTVPNHDLLLVFGETTVNAKATITCKDGYYDNRIDTQPEHTSSALISCPVNGTWSNLPNCTRKDCGNIWTIPIDHAANRNVHNDTKFESTANIDCDEGYYINGQYQPPGISTKTITCLQTGKWNDTPSCIRKECGTLDHITMMNADNRTEINGTSYNSFANVSCNVGYTDGNGGQIEGIFSKLISKLIRCNENGSWENLPKCVRKDCGSVQNIHLNNISYISLHNDTKYGSTADVSCTAGYYNNNKQQTNTTSTTTIRCSHEGHWVDLPSCVRKDCGQLDNLTIPNANKRTLTQSKETKFGSTASIQCDIGYKRKGENQKEGVSTTNITCDETGTWSVLPQCIKKECGNLTSLDISHAQRRRQTNGTTYESTAQIDCDEGYYNQNDSQINTTSTTIVTCSDNGKWKNSPICVPKKCGDLDKPSHGSVNLTGKTYGSNATYSCDAGYEIKGDKTVICQATGHWRSNTPTCQIKDCGSLKAPGNGNISQNSTVYGSKVTFNCNAGYKMIGPATIHCNASGQWSNKTTHCEIKDCNSPTKPRNGSSSTPNGTKFGASAFYRCNPGYTLHGSNSTICLANGTWETVYVNCTLNTCPKTSNITNITNGEANVTSSRASYTCKTGYTLHGNDTLSCTLNGTWNTQPPKCDVTDCPNLTNPKNGHVDQSNGTTYLSVSTYRCDIGYTLKGKHTTKCTKDGMWDNPNVTCEIKDCGNLTKPSNGNITFSNGIVYQSEARYSCDTGYTLHGDDITNCASSGNWAPHSMNCTINDCGPLNNPENGNVTNGSTKYNSTAHFTCIDGYHLTNNKTSVCEASGNWSIIPKCKIKDCHNLTDPINGHVDQRNGTTYLSVSRYRCHTGYTLKGKNTTKCTKDGMWDNPNVTCEIKEMVTKTPKMCFSCDGMSSPQYCDRVNHCQQNQICYTESYQTDYGNIFRSGCMDVQKCHKEENSTSSSVCVQCCTTDMCNNKGCGNTDFPSREHRGPMCFDCQHVGDANTCRKVTMCSSDQVCSIEKQQWGDSYHYKLGCTHHLCNSLSHEMFGQAPSCHTCCKDDYCNRNCTSGNSVPGEIFVG